MPIYEYKCEDCGQEFECIVARSKRDKVRCTECNSKNTKRLLCAAKFNMGGSSTGAQSLKSCTSCSGSSCQNCK